MTLSIAIDPDRVCQKFRVNVDELRAAYRVRLIVSQAQAWLVSYGVSPVGIRSGWGENTAAHFMRPT